jgi:hypothetical protein
MHGPHQNRGTRLATVEAGHAKYEAHPCKVLFHSEWGDDRMFMLVG